MRWLNGRASNGLLEAFLKTRNTHRILHPVGVLYLGWPEKPKSPTIRDLLGFGVHPV